MSRGKKFALLLGDIFTLYISLCLTLLLRYGAAAFPGRFHDHFPPFSLLFVFWLLIFSLFDLYRQKAFVNFNAIADQLLRAVGTALLTSIALFYLFGTVFVLTPKTNLFIFALIFTILDYLVRVAFKRVASFRPSPAIVIGNSPQIQELAAFLERTPHTGYRVAEWIRVLSPAHLADLPERIHATGAHTVIIEPRLVRNPEVVQSIYRLLPLGVVIFNFSDFYELMFERVPLEELEEGWFIEHVVTRRPAYDAAKRLVDFVLSLAIFVVLLPLTILVAILVRLTSRGPAIFAQKRVGKNNREFFLYKFRSMNTWSGGTDGTPAWTLPNDARITGFGKFPARHASGRNCPSSGTFCAAISPSRARARSAWSSQSNTAPSPITRSATVVQPGLTGWAQINYRPSASLDEAKEKLRYDIYYVKNRSFLLDAAIILKTIKYIFASNAQ